MAYKFGQSLSLKDLITNLEVYESSPRVLSRPLRRALIIGIVTNVVTITLFYYCLPFFIKNTIENIDSIEFKSLISFIIPKNYFFCIVCVLLDYLSTLVLKLNFTTLFIKFGIIAVTFGLRRAVPEFIHWVSFGVIFVDTILTFFTVLTLFCIITSYFLPIILLILLVLFIIKAYS